MTKDEGQMLNNKYQMANGKSLAQLSHLPFDICHLIFAIFVLRLSSFKASKKPDLGSG